MEDRTLKKTSEHRPAVFFDRDGTLIDDTGYLADPAGINFYPGVVEALKKLQEKGYLLVVITNQSGIGRGYFDEETALVVNLSMLSSLWKAGVELAAIYYCPHHPREGCRCRKPDTLMIKRALDELGIDIGNSWVVGDMDKDVLAGEKAGLRSILVETGKVEKGDPPADVKRCASVPDAVHYILREGAA